MDHESNLVGSDEGQGGSHRATSSLGSATSAGAEEDANTSDDWCRVSESRCRLPRSLPACFKEVLVHLFAERVLTLEHHSAPGATAAR